MKKSDTFIKLLKRKPVYHALLAGAIVLYYLITALVYRSERSSAVKETDYFLFALTEAFLFGMITMAVSFLLIRVIRPAARYSLENAGKIIGIVIMAGVAGYFCELVFLVPLKLSIGFTVINKTLIFGIVHSISKLSFAVLVIVFITTVQKLHQSEQLKKEAEKDRIAAQLKLIRSQTHPHFLFNTLNNIYSFALHQQPETPELLLKLANLLGYMLYDSNVKTISLGKEIASMKDYIELEKIRFGNRLEISMDIRGQLDNKEIPPLLLLPIIENAFKFVTPVHDKSWVSLEVNAEGGQLYAKVMNSFLASLPNNDQGQMNKVKGIGLDSVIKQLDYFFGENGILQTKIVDDVFIAEIKITGL